MSRRGLVTQASCLAWSSHVCHVIADVRLSHLGCLSSLGPLCRERSHIHVTCFLVPHFRGAVSLRRPRLTPVKSQTDTRPVSRVLFDTQAVASMLMGIQPDNMLEEPHLLCHNPDVAEERNVTWAYPPVLLLKASEDHDMMKERIDNTKNFFRRHVRLSRPSQSFESPVVDA